MQLGRKSVDILKGCWKSKKVCALGQMYFGQRAGKKTQYTPPVLRTTKSQADTSAYLICNFDIAE